MLTLSDILLVANMAINAVALIITPVFLASIQKTPNSTRLKMVIAYIALSLLIVFGPMATYVLVMLLSKVLRMSRGT